jgi:hypothetical protein
MASINLGSSRWVFQLCSNTSREERQISVQKGSKEKPCFPPFGWCSMTLPKKFCWLRQASHFWYTLLLTHLRTGTPCLFVLSLCFHHLRVNFWDAAVNSFIVGIMCVQLPTWERMSQERDVDEKLNTFTCLLHMVL